MKSDEQLTPDDVLAVLSLVEGDTTFLKDGTPVTVVENRGAGLPLRVVKNNDRTAQVITVDPSEIDFQRLFIDRI